jgi:hypothetical protein
MSSIGNNHKNYYMNNLNASNFSTVWQKEAVLKHYNNRSNQIENPTCSHTLDGMWNSPSYTSDSTKACSSGQYMCRGNYGSDVVTNCTN